MKQSGVSCLALAFRSRLKSRRGLELVRGAFRPGTGEVACVMAQDLIKQLLHGAFVSGELSQVRFVVLEQLRINGSAQSIDVVCFSVTSPPSFRQCSRHVLVHYRDDIVEFGKFELGPVDKIGVEDLEADGPENGIEPVLAGIVIPTPESRRYTLPVVLILLMAQKQEDRLTIPPRFFSTSFLEFSPSPLAVHRSEDNVSSIDLHALSHGVPLVFSIRSHHSLQVLIAFSRPNLLFFFGIVRFSIPFGLTAPRRRRRA
jgi:hypothetical protein